MRYNVSTGYWKKKPSIRTQDDNLIDNNNTTTLKCPPGNTRQREYRKTKTSKPYTYIYHMYMYIVCTILHPLCSYNVRIYYWFTWYDAGRPGGQQGPLTVESSSGRTRDDISYDFLDVDSRQWRVHATAKIYTCKPNNNNIYNN